MLLNPDPNNDPNAAYEVVPMKEEPHMPKGWWSDLCNGIPVWHFAEDLKGIAERYATEYRKRSVQTKVWEKSTARKKFDGWSS
jgi:hypothetical protein